MPQKIATMIAGVMVPTTSSKKRNSPTLTITYLPIFSTCRGVRASSSFRGSGIPGHMLSEVKTIDPEPVRTVSHPVPPLIWPDGKLEITPERESK
jgi:hypothetical protein